MSSFPRTAETRTPAATDRHTRLGPVSEFIERHYRHFNAASLNDAALAYIAHLESGGSMMMALAGAMSTAELGVSLAEMIRQGKVHAVCCTGANLEEDVFNLVAHSHYERLPRYRDLTPEDEQKLLDRHLNRVTDTCIPEHEAMRRIESVVLEEWKRSDAAGERLFPHEFLYRVLLSGRLNDHLEIDPADSWLLAAAQANLPIFVPGWEDSTLGNIYAAHCIQGTFKNVHTVRSGIEYMIRLAEWYRADEPAQLHRALPDRRRHRRRLSHLRRADAQPGSPDGRRAAVGLLLPDQRLDDELRVVLGRGPQRKDHLGQTRREHAEVHHRVRRHDRRAAGLCARLELVGRWDQDQGPGIRDQGSA